MMLDRNLELFLRVAEYGGVTRAAKALYITQPAVSNALAKLEEALGGKLFFRDKRKGLILTDLGKKILLCAKQMEALDQRMYQLAREERGLLGGRVRIAALTSLVSTVLSRPLRDFRSRYPAIQVELMEGTPNDIFTMVQERTADFAVSCSPFGRFDAVSLARDRIMAMLPPGGGERDAVSLSRPPDTLIVNRPAYETILDHITPKSAVKLDNVILVQNAETAIHLVMDGVGVGILSEYTLDTLAPGAPRVPVLPRVEFDIGLFANDLDDLTPAAAAFVQMIRGGLTPQP